MLELVVVDREVEPTSPKTQGFVFPSNMVLTNFLEQVATTSEKAELLPALGANKATLEQWKRAIEIVIKRTVLTEPFIGGCLARLCPCCLSPTVARLAICISCHTTLYSKGRLYRHKVPEPLMTEQEKAREKVELEEIEKAAKDAEHTATEDEGEEEEEADEAEGVIHADVEMQTDGKIPEYQAWAFEEDYTNVPSPELPRSPRTPSCTFQPGTWTQNQHWVSTSTT